MPSTPHPSSETIGNAVPVRASRWVLVERCFTLVAIAGVILLAISAIQGMLNLFSENVMPVTTSEFESTQANLTPSLWSPIELDNTGYWQIAGWQWELGVDWVPEQEVDQHLENVPPAANIFSEADKETAARLIEALDYLPFQKVDRGDDNSLYRLDDNQLKMRIATTTSDGVTFPVSIAAAVKVDKKQWTVFEMREKHPVSSPHKKVIPAIPSDSQILCSRSNQRDEVVFQVIQTETNISDLLDELARTGWQVERDLVANPTNQVYLVTKQDQLFHLWRVFSQSNQGHQVALMRISAPNTQTEQD